MQDEREDGPAVPIDRADWYPQPESLAAANTKGAVSATHTSTDTRAAREDGRPQDVRSPPLAALEFDID